MLQNNSQMLGLYDEMTVMYGQLDAYKHSGSTLDRSTLLDLYNGGSWARNFKNKNGPSKLQKTAFNMAGYIQPAFVVNMLEKPDIDGFNDQQLFDCPPEVDFKYGALKVPVDATLPSLDTIFRIIRMMHVDKLVYTMNEEAMANFVIYHDSLVERKKGIPDDENCRGVLSKAKGQFARIAMVLHVLNQAVKVAQTLHLLEQTNKEAIVEHCSDWSTDIGVYAVVHAEVIMNHFIAQKFCMMGHLRPLSHLSHLYLQFQMTYRNLPKLSPPSKISPPPSLAKSYCKGSLLFKSTPTPQTRLATHSQMIRMTLK